MNDNDKNLSFTGRGFSQDPMTPEELAEARERANHYDRSFLSPEEFLKKTGLKWVSDAARGFPAFLRAFGAVATVAGGYAAAKAMGWL